MNRATYLLYLQINPVYIKVSKVVSSSSTLTQFNNSLRMVDLYNNYLHRLFSGPGSKGRGDTHLLKMYYISRVSALVDSTSKKFN